MPVLDISTITVLPCLFLSLSIMFLRFVYVVACVRVSFFLQLDDMPLDGEPASFSHFSAGGHWVVSTS